MIKEQESIGVTIYEEDNTSIVQETSEGMRTRYPPKAPALMCGMLHNGGCTKAFKMRQELALYIFDKYGEH